MAVSPERRYTYSDLLAFPEDGLRREVIDGELYVSASPNLRHQRIARRLLMLLGNYLEQHGGGEVFIAPLDVYFTEDRVVEPDIIFVAEDRSGVLTDAKIEGAPSLLIEVVSDRRRDLVVKRDLYGRQAVPEYWAVDPDADRFEVFRLEGEGYGPPMIVEPGGTVSPLSLPGLVVDVGAILAR